MEAEACPFQLESEEVTTVRGGGMMEVVLARRLLNNGVVDGTGGKSTSCDLKGSLGAADNIGEAE